MQTIPDVLERRKASACLGVYIRGSEASTVVGERDIIASSTIVNKKSKAAPRLQHGRSPNDKSFSA